MTKAPAFQFYTGDWLKDPHLSMCSPATRGIWMDLLCAMHENDRSGLITGTSEQLARLCRCTAVELDHAISELQTSKTADVTKRHENVTIINRRMAREFKYRVSARERKRLERDRNTSVKGCHADVTPSRARSSSSSSSKENISLPRDTKESAGVTGKNPAREYQGRFTEEGQEIHQQALEVLHYLNERCGKSYHDTYRGIRHIIERLHEDFSVDDLKYIIDTKLRDPYFQKNRNLFSPDTLFKRDNAEKYRYEKPEDFSGNSDPPRKKLFRETNYLESDYPIDFDPNEEEGDKEPDS